MIWSLTHRRPLFSIPPFALHRRLVLARGDWPVSFYVCGYFRYAAILGFPRSFPRDSIKMNFECTCRNRLWSWHVRCDYTNLDEPWLNIIILELETIRVTSETIKIASFPNICEISVSRYGVSTQINTLSWRWMSWHRVLRDLRY